MEKILWWAYLHANGTIQVKRYLGDPLDLQEARESPFVQKCTKPFEAVDRISALNEAMELLA